MSTSFRIVKEPNTDLYLMGDATGSYGTRGRVARIIRPL